MKKVERVFQAVLKAVLEYKGDDPCGDTLQFDAENIIEKNKVTAEELATACNKLYECGHTFGLTVQQFTRARRLRNYAERRK